MGVAAAELNGALEQIAHLVGGRVESYPEDVTDRKVTSTFPYNSRLAI